MSNIEALMRQAFDGTFKSVHRHSGEIESITVPRDWIPPYHDDLFWGIQAVTTGPRRPNKCRKSKGRRTAA